MIGAFCPKGDIFKEKFDGRKGKLLYDSLYNYILNDIHDVLIYLNNGLYLFIQT